MSCPVAHSSKFEGIERDTAQNCRMVDEWRLRLAYVDLGWFKPVDPLTLRQRRSADAHFAQRLARANFWLHVHQVAFKHRMRQARRKGWSVILGGRFAGGAR
jgi:hypothetical protein